MYYTCMTCHIPLYFKACYNDDTLFKYVFGRHERSLFYIEENSDLLYHQMVLRSGNEYAYDRVEYPHTLRRMKHHHGKVIAGIIFIFDFTSDGGFFHISVKQDFADETGELERRVVCSFYLMGNFGKRDQDEEIRTTFDFERNSKWKIDESDEGEGVEVTLGFEPKIPAEFTKNGATYFETEEGAKHLDRILSAIKPYLKDVLTRLGPPVSDKHNIPELEEEDPEINAAIQTLLEVTKNLL
jgi:hypothetical protein